MNKYVEVEIEWLREQTRLEQIPIDGIRFCPQIKFEEEGDKIPQWTAEIIIRKSINKYLCYGDLRYLFKEAPNHLLKKGKKFIIFDGPFPIANGKVVTNSIS